jgi:hypothetical protein
MAAAEFWNETQKANKFFAKLTSRNPFKSANSDVVVAEALIFLVYNLDRLIELSVEKNELTDADLEAAVVVGPCIRHIIQEMTGWHLTEALSSRFGEYARCTYTNEPVVDAFCGVLLRSIGKRAIHEPDRRLDFRSNNAPLMLWTTTYMAAHLAAYRDFYKNVVEHYPMD